MTAAIWGCRGGDPPPSDARRGRRRNLSGWPPARTLSGEGRWGGSPCRAAADAAAANDNKDGHISDIRVVGIVEDDGDDDDLDDDDDDDDDNEGEGEGEGEDKNGDDDDDDAVVLGKAAAAAAPTTRMVATMATTMRVTWTAMVAAMTAATSMTSMMTTTTMG